MKRSEIIFIIFSLLLAAFLRLWHLDRDLLFHRDQGMHALGIWQIWHEHQIKLLGHSTDVDGINHGPIFYWLMTLSYSLSGGDPVAASAFQIILEILSLPFLYLATRKLFGITTAKLTLLIYAISFGLIGYSRWLSNVTPIFPLSHLLLFLLTQEVWRKRWFYFGILGLIVGLVSQLNGAVGFALTPTVLWIIKPKLTKADLLIFIAGVMAPAVPLILFDLRHNFLTLSSILRFASSGDGTGLSLQPLLGNIRTYFEQLGHLISYPLLPLGMILWLVGLILSRDHPEKRLIWTWLLMPLIVLALVKRGGFGFFFVFNFGLSVALVCFAVTKSQSKILAALISLAIGLNLVSAYSLREPGNGLIPIGSANLITISDRKHAVDWIYQMAAGEPFAVWIYTIPYYQDDAYIYVFLWYGQKQHGYQPISLGGFSPGELKGIKHFFTIYEPDWDRPWRLESWKNEVRKNWGEPTSAYRSHDAFVSWYRLDSEL